MGRHHRLLFNVFLAELMCLILGYHLSVMSGAMLLLVDPFQLDIIWQQLIVAASGVGGALSLLSAGYLVHKFGRKKLIIGSNVITCTGSVLTAASNAKEVILFGRFLTGIGISIPSLVVPMYVSECSPANIRGRLGSLTQVMINGGIFLSAVMGGAFSAVHSGWRYLFALPCLVGVVQFVGFLFAPETPRWLIDKGRVDEARTVLEVLRDGEDNVQSEIEDIQRAITEAQTEQAQNSFVMIRVLKSASVRRALILAVFLAIIFQVTGTAAALAYSGTILKMAGFASGNAAWLATVPFAIQFIATSVITTFLIDKAGRRALFVGSHIGIVISMIVLGLGFYLSSTDSPTVSPTIVETYSNGTNITDCQFRSCHDCINSVINQCGFCSDVMERATCVPVFDNGSAVGGRCFKENTFNQTYFRVETDVCPSRYSWIPVLGLSLFELAFGSGSGVVWIVISEVFPLWARSTCCSIATATIWLFRIIASMTFLSVAEAITIYGIFWLYGACALLAVIYTCIFLPETRGKRLEDIEKLFMAPKEYTLRTEKD